MTNKEKEQMVLQVLGLKRRGLRICIYGLTALAALWIGLALADQRQLAVYTVPLIAVFIGIYYYYQKKSRDLAHKYASQLKEENACR